MKKLLYIGTTAATAVTVAAMTSGTAFAWHPQPEITKYVQNDTQSIAKSDADNLNTAVAAKPGDQLTYTVEITNKATSSDGIDNSMQNTVLTDNLPAGVELVSDPSQRVISDNIGNVAPGHTVTKTYKVKVTSQKDGDVITNEACFTGDAEQGDHSQSGCDKAVVKVNVPKAPVTPPAPVKPQEQPLKSQPAPAELPNTGVSASALIGTALTALAGYAAFIVRARRVNG